MEKGEGVGKGETLHEVDCGLTILTVLGTRGCWGSGDVCAGRNRRKKGKNNTRGRRTEKNTGRGVAIAAGGRTSEGLQTAAGKRAASCSSRADRRAAKVTLLDSNPKRRHRRGRGLMITRRPVGRRRPLTDCANWAELL